MDTTTALKRTAQHGGPVILGAGMALLAVALTTPGPYRSQTAAPAPTVTVTPPPQVVTVPPSPTPPPRISATLVVQRQPVTVSQSAARPPGQAGPSTSGNMTAEQAPRPARRPAPSSSCSGVLAVQLPLGVLPGCAITVGGSR